MDRPLDRIPPGFVPYKKITRTDGTGNRIMVCPNCDHPRFPSKQFWGYQCIGPGNRENRSDGFLWVCIVCGCKMLDFGCSSSPRLQRHYYQPRTAEYAQTRLHL